MLVLQFLVSIFLMCAAWFFCCIFTNRPVLPLVLPKLVRVEGDIYGQGQILSDAYGPRFIRVSGKDWYDIKKSRTVSIITDVWLSDQAAVLEYKQDLLRRFPQTV